MSKNNKFLITITPKCRACGWWQTGHWPSLLSPPFKHHFGLNGAVDMQGWWPSLCTTVLIFCSLAVCQYISSHQWWNWNTAMKRTQRQNLLSTAPIKMNRQHEENREWKFCSIDEKYINRLIQKFTYTLQNLQNVNYFNKIRGIIIQNACYLFIGSFFLLEHQWAFETSVIIAYESLSCPQCEKMYLKIIQSLLERVEIHKNAWKTK